MATYDQLGVKPVINAKGNITTIGGSLMPQQVVDAMSRAAANFVDLDELNIKAGRYLAQLIGVEDAFVSAGAASGMQLSAAACLTGEDVQIIRRLPHTEGMRNEFVISSIDPHIYVHQGMEACGGKLVRVGSETEVTSEQILAGVSDRTAAIVHFLGRQSMEQLREVCRGAAERGVPVIVDAAAQLPPRSNLTEVLSAGASLVVFSGGKGLRGPQCTGLVLGKRSHVGAARLNASPFSAVGRGMKVGKEEILGLVTAVELFLQRSDEEDLEEWGRRADKVVDILGDVSGVKVYVLRENQSANPQCAPRVYLDLEPKEADRIIELLRKGDPPIAARRAPEGICVDPMTMVAGEEVTVARRLKELLTEMK
jgi:L-seryl-tRNA(Ser) seleniumtransferase